MWTDLGVEQWVAAAAAVFAGGLVTGASGFGFALVTAPVLLWVVDPVTMVTTNLGLSVLTRLPIVFHDRRDIDATQTRVLVLGGLFGLPLGVALIGMLDSSSARIVVNAFVILFGAPFLLTPKRIPVLESPGPFRTGLVGMLSGALTTSSSLSGPPIVLWLTGQRLPRHAFRGTTSLVGVSLNVSGIALLLLAGRTTLGSLGIPMVLLPFAALGGYTGHRVLQRITDEAFVRMAAGLVVLASTGGITVTLMQP